MDRPERCVMFEDTPANLVPAAELGFETILIGAKAEPTSENQTRLDTLGLKPTLVAPNINTALKSISTGKQVAA